MPFDANGNYTLPAIYKATAGQTIYAAQHNTPLEDIRAALNVVLMRDGRAGWTGNQNGKGYRLTGLANGVDDQDAATTAQVTAAVSASQKLCLLLASTTLQTVSSDVTFGGKITFSGTVLVPDGTDFTTQNALNARTAEARYIRSVPAASSGNIQIADIEFDASGNVLITDANKNVTTFYPPNLTVSTLNGFPCLTYKIASNRLVQEFYTGQIDTLDGPVTVLFPTAYKAGTMPLITTSFPFFSGSNYMSAANFNTAASNPSGAVRNTGFDVYGRHLDTTSTETCGFFVRSVGEI